MTTETKPGKDAPVTITDQSAADYSSYFFSDSASYETQNTGESSGRVVKLSADLGKFAGGDGTPGNPYQIANIEELTLLANKANNREGDYATVHYQLTQDIDLTSFGNWTPIGSSTEKFFKGSFDGNGNTITGLTVIGGGDQGLFGCIQNATIKNLTVENGTLSGRQATGAIVGYATSSSIIENCHNKGVAVKGTSSDIGGIAGGIYNGGTLSGCTNSTTVSIPTSATPTGTTFSSVGGVVGSVINETGHSSVVNCVNYGDVTIQPTSYYSSGLGGVAGDSNGTVTNCANYGTVTNSEKGMTNGGKKTTGGVVGFNEGSIITNCVNGGTVTDGNTTTPGYLGGVAGYNETITVGGTSTAAVVQFSYTSTGSVVGENTGTTTGCGTYDSTSNYITLGNDFVGDTSSNPTITYVPNGNTIPATALNSRVERADGKENVVSGKWPRWTARTGLFPPCSPSPLT